MLQTAAVFEQAFPACARDLLLRFDFVEHDLRPRAAPWIELLISLHTDQFRDYLPEFLVPRFNFAARAWRQTQVEFQQLRAEFVRHLIETVGVAAVPGSSFFSDPQDGATLIRFCFCKKYETLKASEERLRLLRIA